MAATGGTLAGLPVIGSGVAPQNQLTIVNPSELLVADDDGIEIVGSTNAHICQSDDPNSESSPWVSLFQADATGLKTVRYVNWKMRRPLVAYASNFVVPFATTA